MGLIASVVRQLVASGVDTETIMKTIETMEIELAATAQANEPSAASLRTRRYRERGGGKIPMEMRNEVFERDGFACLECGATDNLACDHAVPVSKGGETTLENLQTLCKSCNSRKRDRIRKYDRRNSADIGGIPRTLADITPSPDGPPDKETPQTPKENNPPLPPALNTSEREPARSSVRGKRLDPSWALPNAWGQWAVDELGLSPDIVRREASMFRDYWVAKIGKDASKADWLATWRNWMRRVGTSPPRAPPRPMSRVDELKEDLRRRIADEQNQQDAAGGFDLGTDGRLSRLALEHHGRRN